MHPVKLQLERAEQLIATEKFDELLDIYTDDALMVIEPGKTAVGKHEIKKALEVFAIYFKSGLKVEQRDIEILEAEDTALVLAKIIISVPNLPLIERKSTSVFVKRNGVWLCAIDNFYGHEILKKTDN